MPRIGAVKRGMAIISADGVPVDTVDTLDGSGKRHRLDQTVIEAEPVGRATLAERSARAAFDWRFFDNGCAPVLT